MPADEPAQPGGPLPRPRDFALTLWGMYLPGNSGAHWTPLEISADGRVIREPLAWGCEHPPVTPLAVLAPAAMDRIWRAVAEARFFLLDRDYYAPGVFDGYHIRVEVATQGAKYSVGTSNVAVAGLFAIVKAVYDELDVARREAGASSPGSSRALDEPNVNPYRNVPAFTGAVNGGIDLAVKDLACPREALEIRTIVAPYVIVEGCGRTRTYNWCRPYGWRAIKSKK